MNFLKEIYNDWHSLYRRDRLLFVSAIFLPLLFSAFFFASTLHIRTLFYISLPFSFALLVRDRRHVWEFIKENHVFWALCAIFLGYMSLSVAWSETTETGRYFEKGKLFLLIGIGVLTTSWITHQFPKMITGIGLSFITAAFITAAFLTIPHIITSIETDRFTRMHGLGRADNPVQAALLYGLSVVMIAFGNFGFLSKLPVKIMLALPPLSAMLCTQSRGPLIALLLALSAIKIIRCSKKIVTSVLLLAALGLLSLTAYFALEQTNIIKRQDTGRTEIWLSALDKIAEKPITGYGLANRTFYTYTIFNGRTEQVSHPHSLYLSTLVQGGYIAAILLLGLMAMTIRQTFLSPGPEIWPLGCVIMGALLGLVDFGGYVINVSTEWLVFWWPAAFIFALSRPSPQKV